MSKAAVKTMEILDWALGFHLSLPETSDGEEERHPMPSDHLQCRRALLLRLGAHWETNAILGVPSLSSFAT